jgi:ribosomal protein L44E
MIENNFGTNGTRDKIDFTLICDKCHSKNVRIIPVTHYEDNNYKKPSKITLKLYCPCCQNEYESEIFR